MTVQRVLTFANAILSRCQGIATACEAIHANAAGLTKKKRIVVKGANLPASSDATPNDKAADPKGKEKQVEMRLPSGVDQVYRPLVARNVVDGPLSRGWTNVYVEFFTCGNRYGRTKHAPILPTLHRRHLRYLGEAEADL
ncbi:hypothetical protein LIER_05108 [Lithospermum erythrorhizon]|uniref:Uncharacterized protein n=1 Tax=Lithospermum erythrorhizon TaxID=34254 RepID=A0AAV3NZA5_LITER